MRLIDADALMNTLQELFEEREKEQKFRLTGSGGAFVTWNDAICNFKTAPTVDAVPVRHGEWMPSGIPGWRCSCCGKTIVLNIGIDGNYCPNCGAKMDGGKDDE